VSSLLRQIIEEEIERLDQERGAHTVEQHRMLTARERKRYDDADASLHALRRVLAKADAKATANLVRLAASAPRPTPENTPDSEVIG
jgi:membrane protein involved in colicin uptake